MSKTIYHSEKYDLIRENNQLFIKFTALQDEPKLIFESLENYLYEVNGADYIEKLAMDVLDKPATYDQRLRYSLTQKVSPPREAFYFDGSYYCENHTPKRTANLEYIKYAIGMYSEGKSLVLISEFLKEIVTKIDFQNIDISERHQYYLVSSLICLVRLLELDSLDENKELTKLVAKDRLLDLFFYKKQKPNMDLPIIHQDPYLFLSLALTSKEEHLTQFCINFYHSMKTVSWYESHKNNLLEFFGYWSFEIAYLVRFMGIIDASFMDHMYYPRDLALRKFLPTWSDSKQGESARQYKTQFSNKKPENKESLTQEILEYIEQEYSGTIKTVLSSTILNKTITKIADSNLFFESIGNDPSEKEFNKIRGVVEDLVETLSEHSQNTEQNNHLQDLEAEIKAKVIQHFNSKKHPTETVEPFFNEYFRSERFSDLAGSNTNNMGQLIHKLKKAQSVKDEAKYWDELENIFNSYGLFDLSMEENKGNKSIDKTPIKSSGKKDAVSFKISFKDYL